MEEVEFLVCELVLGIDVWLSYGGRKVVGGMCGGLGGCGWCLGVCGRLVYICVKGRFLLGG